MDSPPLDGDWRKRINDFDGRLAQGLSFDSVNFWLEQGRFFAEQIQHRPRQRELGFRCLYRIVAYVALAIDFLLRDLSFVGESEKERLLRDGFTYGDRGSEGMKHTIETSMALIEQFVDGGKESAQQIRTKVAAEFEQLSTAILNEYFTRGEVGRRLFDVARDLEGLAMAKSFTGHAETAVAVRALIGCLLDYWGYDRADFALSAPLQTSLTKTRS